MKTQVEISKEIYTWAITRAGYTLEDFAKRYPNVYKWVEDKKKPTIKQLEAFSKQVHLPFGYLFLPEPLKEPIPIPFFRTNGPQAATVDVNVYDTILLLQHRQDWLREYLLEHDFEPLPFVGKFTSDTDYKVIVDDIRSTLQISADWASTFRTWEESLDFLTQKIEEHRIIIVFNGIVENSTNRPIKVDECRGFVLVDNIAPFMFINNADAKAAQLFTIVHELAHIWLGFSAGFDNSNLLPANDPIELLCDKIAAEFLVPASLLVTFWQRASDIKTASRHFKVSPIVIARRALDLALISRADFFSFYNDYTQEQNFRKKTQPPGGDFYATTKKRLGLTFAAHVNKAVQSGELLYRDAYRLTSLKGNTFDEFFKRNFAL
jgi:Zn-dependent peptidase ImmA (M78 family)